MCVDHVQKAAKDTVSEKDRSNTNKELAYEKIFNLRNNQQMQLK